ncbi:vacuolar protein sorting-associated protein [Babesia gibsoni]|uniref:Vacuolar protein sorting-associated protein n=1 Tax=Babesia gibsoni TaxID=33632 RepID=A0AAD8UUV5_BABGI|nr:vacuolar protein sorting-associated protein [Babesia gibsoni]
MSVKVFGEPLTLKALPLGGISTFEVSNRSLWFGLNDGRILRHFCEDSSSSQETKTNTVVSEYATLHHAESNTASDVQHLFVDAKSFHVIACFSSGEHWYFNFQGKDPIFLTSLKGIHVRSICFTDATTEDSTGPILIGTQNGIIIEGRINYKKTTFSFKKKYYVPGGEPVLDIFIVPIIYKDCRTHVIIALSTRCLYEFFGGISLEATLTKYTNDVKNPLRYEVPLAGPAGQLLVEERDDGSHEIFWTNATGIVHANIPYRIGDDAEYCLPKRPKVITYPRGPKRPHTSLQESRIHQGKTFMRSPATHIPRSVVVSNNTVFLLFEDSISVVNTIVGEQVATLSLPQEKFGKARCLAQDPINGETWMLTGKGVYEVILKDDTHDAWQHHLMKGDTERALAFCKTPAQRDSVLLKAAYEFYEQGRFVDAARMFGQLDGTNPEFDNICLNFLKKEQEAALLEYVSLKMKQRRWFTHDPRFVIITVWIIEMLSYRYRDLCLTIEAASAIDEATMDDLCKKREDFKKHLLSTVGSLAHVDDMSSAISFLMQTMMGCGQECVEFAKMKRDYTNIICYLVSSGHTESAFHELFNVPPGEKRESLLLRFSPLLFMNEPHLFHKKSFGKLEHTILIPVILLPLMMESSRYLPHSITIAEKMLSDGEYKDEYTKSLLWCCYIILLANLETPDELFKVLSSCNMDFSNSDLDIALRYLKRKSLLSPGWKVPFIMLQSMCGLHDDALEMALAQGDIRLAEECANRPSDCFARRRLWRLILTHYTTRDDVPLHLILERSNGILSVNDLLHLVKPEIHMGQLKEIIEKYINSYEENLQDRRREIEHLCTCIEEAKYEMQMAAKRYVSISENKECIVCGSVLTSSSFIVFPCSHMFHLNCVSNTLRRLLDGAELLQIEQLHNRFIKVGDKKSVKEYHEFLSKACLICGHNVEILANKPFISKGEMDQIELWNIT